MIFMATVATKIGSVGDARREALINSLRVRFQAAERAGNAEAKLALFREAAYLDIQPELFSAAPLSPAA